VYFFLNTKILLFSRPFTNSAHIPASVCVCGLDLLADCLTYIVSDVWWIWGWEDGFINL